ncbi:MAG: M1 family metallopeptidase [Bacillaceae bacterium]|nr:M1 family metallopeptidase [Bacillaceae bacterium]
MKRYFIFYLMIMIFLAACADRNIEDAAGNTDDDNQLSHDEEKDMEDVSTEDKKNRTEPDQKSVTYGPVTLIESEIDQEAIEAFTPNTPEPGNYAKYKIDLEVKDDGWLTVHAKIEVENLSNDAWDQVAFYFIPQAFLKETKPKFMETHANLENLLVLQDKQPLDYELNQGQLVIHLNQQFTPDTKQTFTITYDYQPAQKGLRLKRTEDSIVLAQWYPMLAAYQNGSWNIHPFHTNGESYFTGRGEYHITYHSMKNYLVASTAVKDPNEPHQEYETQAKNVPDYLIAFLDPEHWEIISSEANGKTIRLFYQKGNDEQAVNYLETARQTIIDLEQLIGIYPYEELDIIMNGGGMEYPGVIEAGTFAYPFVNGEHTLIHEIAHQWFYFQVMDDPFNEGWLDETLTELTTAAYLMEKYQDKERALRYPKNIGGPKGNEQITVNQPLNEFKQSGFKLIYGDAVIRLWNFFELNGGHQEIFDFLQKYYETYQHKQVTTQEFVRFFQAYFVEDYEEFLDWWLEF